VNIDPSFVGAAGGYALATTVEDLSRFLDTLLAGPAVPPARRSKKC
jgi:hypothetical protein